MNMNSSKTVILPTVMLHTSSNILFLFLTLPNTYLQYSKVSTPLLWSCVSYHFPLIFSPFSSTFGTPSLFSSPCHFTSSISLRWVSPPLVLAACFSLFPILGPILGNSSSPPIAGGVDTQATINPRIGNKPNYPPTQLLYYVSTYLHIYLSTDLHHHGRRRRLPFLQRR